MDLFLFPCGVTIFPIDFHEILYFVLQKCYLFIFFLIGSSE